MSEQPPTVKMAKFLILFLFGSCFVVSLIIFLIIFGLEFLFGFSFIIKWVLGIIVLVVLLGFVFYNLYKNKKSWEKNE